MRNFIDRRLGRLETEVQKRTDPGRGPVFNLIDDSRDPENEKRLREAAQFKRDNPKGQIVHHIIVHPPNGEPNWERFIASGTNVQVAEKQALVREEAFEEAIKPASMRPLRRPQNYRPLLGTALGATGEGRDCFWLGTLL